MIPLQEIVTSDRSISPSHSSETNYKCCEEERRYRMDSLRSVIERDFFDTSALSKEVQDKLFKEMVTTKGKNGTGLGLYMSYSNIKAHFNGNITFETVENSGTTFNLIIPI